jgi:hypothetical protein
MKTKILVKLILYIDMGNTEEIILAVVDRQNRLLSGARLTIEPRLWVSKRIGHGSLFTLKLSRDKIYDLILEWTSPLGTTVRSLVRDKLERLRSKDRITLPVDDVSIKVIDFEGRPVVGAVVNLGGRIIGSTDGQGVVMVEQVPLDYDYTASVAKDGEEVGFDRPRFTSSRTSATIQVGIYDVTVSVRGAAGQPIPGTQVELIKDGVTVRRAATDLSGTALLPKVIGADYEIRATYGSYRTETRLPKGVRSLDVSLGIKQPSRIKPILVELFYRLVITLVEKLIRLLPSF